MVWIWKIYRPYNTCGPLHLDHKRCPRSLLRAWCFCNPVYLSRPLATITPALKKGLIPKMPNTKYENIEAWLLARCFWYLVGVSLSLHTSLLATKSGWMLLGPRSNNTGLKRMYQETMISVSNKEPVAKNLGFYMHHSCTFSGWKPMFWHSSINLTLRLNRLTHDPPHPRIPPHIFYHEDPT